MTGEHLSKEKLQRHYDGDLSGQEAADTQQHLQTCAQCGAELASFERLGDMLRWSTDDATAASDVDFNKMFASIERAVESERASNVVPLQRAESRPRSRVLPTLGAVALAAAAVLMLTRTKEPKPNDAPGAGELALLDNANHSEVVSVKFGSNAGQVFGIALSDSESVPVVWIDDDDGDDGDNGDNSGDGDSNEEE